jgi:hypothetical protein
VRDGNAAATLDQAEIARIFREESGRSVATLIRVVGDIDLAEDAVQDSFAVALGKWPDDGLPPNPGGWIMLLAGPVDQRIELAGEQPARLLAFHLRDGTATVRAYDPAQRRVERGILVPGGSASWSRPLAPDRADGQVGARDRPRWRSHSGARFTSVKN